MSAYTGGASRIRVPGGYLNAEVLSTIQKIAQKYGNGFIHLTTRQGFEIEGIRLEDMDEINKMYRLWSLCYQVSYQSIYQK